MEETRCRSTSRKSQDRTTCGPPEPSSQGRNSNVLSEPHAEEKRSWTANGPDKDRKNESSQSQEKSPQNPTQDGRQKAQARPPHLIRRKDNPRRKSRRPTEKLQRRIKNRTCEAHRNQVDAGIPKKRGRGGQSKRLIKKTEKSQPNQEQTDPGEREERKNKSDRRESSKNVTKASATWCKRWNRKTKSKPGNGRTECTHHKPIQKEPQR